MVRSLAAALSGLSANGGTRVQADAVQRDLLEANSDLLGVWSGWEPNAYDGRDRQFRGTEGTDRTRRFLSY